MTGSRQDDAWNGCAKRLPSEDKESAGCAGHAVGILHQDLKKLCNDLKVE